MRPTAIKRLNPSGTALFASTRRRGTAPALVGDAGSASPVAGFDAADRSRDPASPPTGEGREAHGLPLGSRAYLYILLRSPSGHPPDGVSRKCGKIDAPTIFDDQRRCYVCKGDPTLDATDYSYRPATYWPAAPTVEQLLSRIKGQARRDQARAIMESEGFSGLSAFVARQTLSDDDRAKWGAIHPLLMGGEYLPDLDDKQVEIARISLASTTGDQISVRAVGREGAIHYLVVDEYETEYEVLPTSQSKEPLTLGELIALLDGTNHPDEGQDHFDGLVKSNWEFTASYAEGGPDGLLEAIGFVRVESGFYPDLTAHYAQEAHKWLSNRIAEYEADDLNEYPDALYRLGDAYASGRVVPQDPALAASWWQRSGEQGSVAAQCALSGLYTIGRGVSQDFGQAVYWARQAAEAGHSLGQILLGFAYAEGNGVAQDDVEAHKWFDLAAQQRPAGQPNADAERRDALARRMSKAQVLEASARAAEWKATFDRREK